MLRLQNTMKVLVPAIKKGKKERERGSESEDATDRQSERDMTIKKNHTSDNKTTRFDSEDSTWNILIELLMNNEPEKKTEAKHNIVIFCVSHAD